VIASNHWPAPACTGQNDLAENFVMLFRSKQDESSSGLGTTYFCFYFYYIKPPDQ
jgi:hypothetical protein